MQGKNFTKIMDIEHFPLLIVYSGVPHNTAKVIQKVKNLRENQHEHFDFLMNEIERITNEGEIALKEGDFIKLGKLLDENQSKLIDLGVSTDEIDGIIHEAHEWGAWGAKLTGAGQGGCVIILGDPLLLNKISNNFTELGLKNCIVQLNDQGLNCFDS